MADAVTVSLSAESMAQFRELCSEMASLTKRETRTVIEYATNEFVSKVHKATPIMRKNQPRLILLANVEPQVRAIWRRQGLVTATAKAVRAKTVGLAPFVARGRGYARLGWIAAAKGLAKAAKNVKTVGVPFYNGNPSKVGTFTHALNSPTQPWTESGNQVPYIVELDAKGGSGGKQHFTQYAFDKCIRAMDRRLSYMAERMAREWTK